jgi:hypothetical protein
MVVGVAMMSFLVRDTLKGVKYIVDGIAQGHDTAMPFHSIGIRIISSFMQVAGLLNNFRLELPAAVTTLFTAQSAVAGVGGAVISFNCLMPETRGTEHFILRLVRFVFYLLSSLPRLTIFLSSFFFLLPITDRHCNSYTIDCHVYRNFVLACQSFVLSQREGRNSNDSWSYIPTRAAQR